MGIKGESGTQKEVCTEMEEHLKSPGVAVDSCQVGPCVACHLLACCGHNCLPESF